MNAPSKPSRALRPALDRLFGTRPATIHVRTFLTLALLSTGAFLYERSGLLSLTAIGVGLAALPSRPTLERVYGARLVATVVRLLGWGFLGLFAFGMILPPILLTLSAVFSTDTPPALRFLAVLVATVWSGVWFWVARAVYRYAKTSVG